MTKPPTKPPQDHRASAFELLNALFEDGKHPEKLDELHDMLRLLGVVMGQMALLEVVTDPSDDPKALAAKVSAAKALTQLHESPERVAERLRRSPFADLTVADLERIVTKLKKGETDLNAIVTSLKEHPDGSPTQTQ